MTQLCSRILLGAALALVLPIVAAQTFFLEEPSVDLVGSLALATTADSDTLSDLARAYDQGYREMRISNPDVDPWLPGDGTEVIVPSLYILPNTPREGIVINVPEMRLYYYPVQPLDARDSVATYPISIGRQHWTTPHGVTKIIAKIKDPSWYPPESIREEHAAEGDMLPKIVPAGPDNPLGKYKMRLGIPGYLIHGTNRPYGIGMRVTHGCIRMYPKDIATVFSTVRVGTPVRIVNQPYKVGISGDQIYLEVHPHLEEDSDAFRDQFSFVLARIVERAKPAEAKIDWKELRIAIARKNGIPVVVGKLLEPPLAAPLMESTVKLGSTRPYAIN